MATDQIKLRPYNKKILPFDQIKANLLDFLTGADEANMQLLFSGDTVVGNAIPVTATGNNHVNVGAVGGPFAASNGLGRTVKFNAADSRLQTIAVPPDAGQVYDIGLEVALVEQGLETNPRTGDVQYQTVKEDIGRIGTPDSVTVSGGGLVIVLNGLLGTQNHAGRQVKVWLKPKEDGGGVGPKSLSASIAFETLTVAFVGGNNQVTTVAQFGQTAPSTTVGDYKVQAIGPTVRKESVENLRNTAGCVFIGAVTSVAAGSPITTITTTDQNVAPYTLATIAPPLKAISRRVETIATAIRDFAYDGTTHRVACGSGQLLHSYDGVFWGATNGTLAITPRAIVYAGGQFVAVGDAGKIFTSPDGITWTARTSGSANNLLGIAYGGGLYCAIGAAGTILTSPDGITWTARTAPAGHATDDIATIGYGNGMFLAGTIATGGGGSTGGNVYKSTDGITWTTSFSIGYAGLPNGSYVRYMTFGAGKFLASFEADDVNTGGYPQVKSSTDGATWADVTFPTGFLAAGFGTSSLLSMIRFANSQFIVTPLHNYGFSRGALVSVDGATFTPVVVPALRSTDYNAAMWDGTSYYFGRGDGDIYITSSLA